MSTPPRKSYSGNGSTYSDRNKRTRRDSNYQNHYSSRSHHENRHYHSNSNTDRTPPPPVNMYIQRRDYYHPTFNQYGAASNNYVTDTNINLSHPPYHNRGRGYGDEYHIPQRNYNYYNDQDYNNFNSYDNGSSEYNRSFHRDDPRRSNERQDKSDGNSKSTPPFAADGRINENRSQYDPRPSDNNYQNRCPSYSDQKTSSQICNIKESNEATLLSEPTSGSVVPAVASAGNIVSADNPKKKKRKRTMSERRKQMHRERARLHQEGLRKKEAFEQLSSSQTTLSNDALLSRSIEERKRNQALEDSRLVALWTTSSDQEKSNNPSTQQHSAITSSKKVSHWKNGRLMQKFKKRSFSHKTQQILDTKYIYYNPFEYLKQEEEYDALQSNKKKELRDVSCKEVGTFNNTYSDLFRYWKPHFVSSLRDKYPGYRLLWLTSYTLHIVALKIFSSVTEDITDFMYVIGECLVGKNIYISRTDVENKAQYQNERLNSNKDCIHLLTNTFTYKIDSFFFPEYRYASGIIAEYYSRRARKLTTGFLLSSTEFAQLCFAKKNDSVSKCFYGNEPTLFRYRKQALESTFDYIDETVAEYPFENEVDKSYFSDDSCASRDHWFEGWDEKPRGMHRNKLKEMLFLLQFSGFETTLKCPCSKLYGDLIFLYGCPLAEEQCKNQKFSNVSALLDHFNSKICIFHTVLSKYLCALCEVSGLASFPPKRKNNSSQK